MAPHTQNDATLTLTIDTGAGPVDYSCQVINAEFTPAAPGESTPIPVGCGSTVSEPGDPANGSLAGEVLKDTSPDGITIALADAMTQGLEVDYVYTESDGTNPLSWSGKATVPQIAFPFAPSKLGRHPLALTLTTSVRA